MNEQVFGLALASLFAASTALGVMFAGFRWGQFAALRVREKQSSKWKAYMIALMPPALFSLSFHFDQLLSPIAGRTFFALGVAALSGVFLHWHHRRAKEFQRVNVTLP